MTNFEIIQYLESELSVVKNELSNAEHEYESKKNELASKQDSLLITIAKMRELSNLTGLDKNGNYKCKKCGSSPSKHYGWEEYSRYTDFGCHECYKFYFDEKEWNENNSPCKEN